MSNYEVEFNKAIAEMIKEGEYYKISPYAINWLNVFIHTQTKVNQIFEATGV